MLPLCICLAISEAIWDCSLFFAAAALASAFLAAALFRSRVR